MTPAQERLSRAISSAHSRGIPLGEHTIPVARGEELHLLDESWSTPTTLCPGQTTSQLTTELCAVSELAECVDLCGDCFAGDAIQAKDGSVGSATPLLMWMAHLGLKEQTRHLQDASEIDIPTLLYLDMDTMWLAAGLEHWEKEEEGTAPGAYPQWKKLAHQVRNQLAVAEKAVQEAAQLPETRRALQKRYRGRNHRRKDLAALSAAPWAIVIWTGTRCEMRDRIQGVDALALLAWDRTESGHGCHLSITPGHVAAKLVRNADWYVLATATLDQEITDVELEVGLRLWQEAEEDSILEDLQRAVNAAKAL